MHPDIAVALAAPDPATALRSWLAGRWAAGEDRQELSHAVWTAYMDSRVVAKDRETDLLADALDELDGWCAPHRSL